jgi:hypothetical protein
MIELFFAQVVNCCTPNESYLGQCGNEPKCTFTSPRDFRASGRKIIAGDDQTDPKPDPSPREPVPVPIFCTNGCYPNPVVISSDQGDDPDMEGREGVPPNSVGSGTR